MGSKTRLLLIYSMGGLLFLTAVTGAAALFIFQRVRRQEDALHARFLERSQWLEQIRSGIYLSGTLARDYFVERDEAEAGALLARLTELRETTFAAMEHYQPASPNLRGEVIAYWKLLELMETESRDRRTAGID